MKVEQYSNYIEFFSFRMNFISANESFSESNNSRTIASKPSFGTRVSGQLADNDEINYYRYNYTATFSTAGESFAEPNNFSMNTAAPVFGSTVRGHIASNDDIDVYKYAFSSQKKISSKWSNVKKIKVSIPWLQSHSIRYREPSIPNDRAT